MIDIDDDSFITLLEENVFIRITTTTSNDVYREKTT
jgi:hypothetical protein